MTNTKGHTSCLAHAEFHPYDKDTVLTAANDGTVRVWDLNGQLNFAGLLSCKQVMKLRSERNLRLAATACAYSTENGSTVAGGGEDGSLHLFDARFTKFARARATVRAAHQGKITCIQFSPDSRTIASRGMDDVVKLWDARKFKEPLKEFPGVPTLYETANVAFSPDGRLVAAGTSGKPGEGSGRVRFFDAQRTEGVGNGPLLEIVVTDEGAGVVRLAWPAKINHLLCATAAGSTRVLYSPVHSTRGALMSVRRQPRRHRLEDFVPDYVGEIENPNALPMYKAKEKVKWSAKRRDPIISKMPERPQGARGSGGKINTQMGFAEFIMRGSAAPDSMKEQDSRAELLKYHKAAEQHKEFIGGAYATNQPKTILASMTLEEEEKVFIEEQKKILSESNV